MSLPGKYSICILEEDNPLKSYFRLKPILITENGRFMPYDAREEYPVDGCIRIVPDKNESGMFKARMRRIGFFAAVDLFDHPNENDKIRANKNFRDDDTERNAYIIYSDVIRDPAPGMLYAVVKEKPEIAKDAFFPTMPIQNVLLNSDGVLQEQVWQCVDVNADTDTCRLQATDQTVDPSQLQVFDLKLSGDRSLTIAVRPLQAAKPIEANAVIPQTVEPKAQLPKEAPEEKTEVPTPQTETEPAVHAYSRILAEQCGLNPRRGRSLKEIVDEKWRASRIESLGLPVQSVQNTNPAQTPVESVVAAMRNVWAQPEQRSELVASLAELENLNETLNTCRNAAKESLINRQLVDLEAQRLQAIRGLEDLRKQKEMLRTELKQEILQEESEAFAEAIEKTRVAREQQAEAEKLAEETQLAAESAQDLLNSLSDGRFEKRLHEFALTSHAAALVRRIDEKRIVPAIVNGVAVNRNTLIERTMTVFEQAGAPISREYAIHLLICASQSPVLLFAGAPGCGKTRTAQLLARALGLSDARMRLIIPGKESIRLTDAPGSAMRMIVLDDANLSPADDFYRGLFRNTDSDQLLLCATIQDDGLPVPAYAFDRTFTIRLSDSFSFENRSTAKSAVPESYPPVTRSTLRKAFPIQEDCIPESLIERLKKLLADFALVGIRPSPRALNAVLDYLGAAVALNADEPFALLDCAVAQRILPALLANAPGGALRALPKILSDWPICSALLEEPLPIRW